MELRQRVVTLQPGHEQMRMQGENLHRVARDNTGFAERLEKANGEISALRGNVKSATSDAMVARYKNAQLINQLKGNQIECVAVAEKLREMRKQLVQLGEQNGRFCKQMAELWSNLSAVSSERDAAVG